MNRRIRQLAAALMALYVALFAMFLLTSQLLPMLRGFAARVLTRRGALELKHHIEKALAMPTPRAALGILAQYVLGTAVFYIGYRQFGVDISVAAAVALACVVYASSILALFPGNFGVLEALCAGFGQINGLSVDQALARAFLYRGANVAGALLLAALPTPREAVPKEQASRSKQREKRLNKASPQGRRLLSSGRPRMTTGRFQSTRAGERSAVILNPWWR